MSWSSSRLLRSVEGRQRISLGDILRERIHDLVTPRSPQNQNRASLDTVKTRATRQFEHEITQLLERTFIVLTFFEYLRQRAFESVLSGAREALECLETQGYFDKPAARIADRHGATIEPMAAIAGDSAKDSAQQQQSESQAQPPERDRRKKPPRLRKRPKRRGSRQ